MIQRWVAAVIVCFSGIAMGQLPSIQTPHFTLAANPADGRWELTDKAADVAWRVGGGKERFGEIRIAAAAGKPTICDLSACAVEMKDGAMVLKFNPLKDRPEAIVRVTIKAIDDGRGASFEYDVPADLKVESIVLLDSLTIGASEKGCAILPTRMGLMIPADSGVAFSRRFGTSEYEGCHMNMIGLVKSGAAALVTWDDAYAAVDLKSELNPKNTPEKQVLRASLNMRKSARSFQIRVGGKGDLNTIAAMYRKVAGERGLLVTMQEKIRQNPDRAKLIGASNVKLWATLSRTMNEESTKEEKANINWTFDEAAQVAEHIRNDLKIDKVLFTVGGWIRRGYDNQHPDVLPAAPECGGDAELAKCAKRVMSLGYLFCLHDNYQDMYRDAPSWDETYLQRNPDGTVTKGGKWAGGRAYYTCAQKAVELAKRPRNLPAVHKLTGANSYFIDTTYAVGPQECHSKEHPLSRMDDIHWKCVISDYARQVFGVFGSECGREWAIPHADFFEGLTGVGGKHYHDANLEKTVGGIVVPLFEMVYRDCIALHGKYGYAIESAAPYVLHHIAIGRPLHYHSLGQHLYWTSPSGQLQVKATPSVLEFKQTGPRQFAITYGWQVDQTPERDWSVFVHFTGPRDAILFQNDHNPSPVATRWEKGLVKQGPFTVRVPAGVTGTFNLLIGMHQPKGDHRAALACGHDRLYRTLLGKVKVEGDKIEFTAQPITRSDENTGPMYVRGDNGWAQGMHSMDRFLKNTHEILSPLYELTAHARMTRFEFVSNDKMVQRSTLGEGESAMIITTNHGSAPYTLKSKLAGEIVLPPMGFAVESPGFAAFCAKSWNGLSYETPTLFTLRALDGKAISQSQKIRVFHGFGDPRLRLGPRELNVERETIVTP